MNARDNTVIATRKPRAKSDAKSSSLWRSNFSDIDPTTRRAARYALQALNANKPPEESRDDGSNSLYWTLISPLLNMTAIGAARRNAILTADETDSADVPHHGRLSWATITNLPVGLLERLAREDGDEPSCPTVAVMAKLFDLDKAETFVLDFLEKRFSIKEFRLFLRISKQVDPLNNCRRLAGLFGVDAPAVKSALSKDSMLRKLQLVELNQGYNDLEDFLGPSDGLRDILQAAPATEAELMGMLVESAPAPEWTLDAFPHLKTHASRLTQVLRSAVHGAESGVNSLLFGPPGTGKSEFAYSLAKEAGVRLYRIRSADEDGDGLGRKGRLVAYLIAQRLLSKSRDALILFDEVEDVFGGDDFMIMRMLLGGKRSGGREKGWMNRLLEENPVPAIWITNDADIMDPAFLRRFLLPIEFSIPPRSVRRAMAEKHLGNCGLPSCLLDELAADDKLAPSQLGAARRLLNLHSCDGNAIAGEQVVRESVGAMRRLLHGSGLPSVRRPATTFDLAFLNMAGGISPQRIVDALERRGRGSLCFYGPPGSGKSEFAHVLSDLLERELVVRQTSDLVSKYVGETERNIATLFRTIDAERGILFLDEVDSLLRDRRQAEHSWEASQVNELLQHMERFPGIFIAATNIVEGLDAASLRRFDFKLHFRSMNPQQRVAMFARETLGDMTRFQELHPSIVNRLYKLDHLTAGDFANVCRQRELLGEDLTAEDFLRRLMQECRWKMEAEA